MTEQQATALMEIMRDIQQSENVLMIIAFALTITMLVYGVIKLIKSH